MQIFTTLDWSDAQIARLEAQVGDARLLRAASFTGEPDKKGAFDACKIVFGNPRVAWVTDSPTLRWLQLESVGFSEYAGLATAVQAGRCKVTNLAGFFDDPVAQSLLTGILALYRGIDLLVQARGLREWKGDALRPHLRTLNDRQVVLFGFGAINAKLAQLLEPFGCEIVAFRREWSADALDSALAVADIVVSAVPDTLATCGVFGRSRLRRLKQTAIFANAGRGSVVDDDALDDLLRRGQLGGAVIDVTRDEPLPAGHPFWTSPNLILSQHTGGGTSDEIDRKIVFFLKNLDRYQRGAELAAVIDFERGY